MGYMRHNAIVITGWDERVDKTREFAKSILPKEHSEPRHNDRPTIISEILVSPMNAYRTFFIGPDGSKEGWLDSEMGNEFRSKLIAYLQDNPHCDWAEIQYGDDGGSTQICRSNQKTYKGEPI